MDDKLEKKVEEILEGIENLKKRKDFNELEYKDKLPELEIGINKYREHKQIEGLRQVISIFHETAGLSRDGSSTFDETIWTTPVQVRDKMKILDELFSELKPLVFDYFKE